MGLMADILPAGNVLVDFQASNKKRLFEQASLLFENQVELPRSLIYDSLFERERLGSTAIGCGIALPHARVKGLKRITCAMLRLSNPIPFDAPDQEPVEFVFFMLGPDKQAERILDIWAHIANMFADEKLRHAIAEAKDAANIFAYLSGWHTGDMRTENL